MTRQLLLSLHDVTPFHLERLVRAERLLTSIGVTRATYLLVPRFHGQWAVERDRAFMAWCRAERAFEVRWFLHGFFHSESLEPAVAYTAVRLRVRALRRYMTAGEGEFVALRDDELRSRLARGVASFRTCFRRPPGGFVPPAWLCNPHLLPALREFGIALTEDHRAVYDVAAGQRLAVPVITWATRTRFRRIASRVLAPVLLHHWAGRAAIRIAIHPDDVDHPATVRSIERVVDAALRDREPAFYDELPYFLSAKSNTAPGIVDRSP